MPKKPRSPFHDYIPFLSKLLSRKPFFCCGSLQASVWTHLYPAKLRRIFFTGKAKEEGNAAVFALRRFVLYLPPAHSTVDKRLRSPAKK
ncbi:MAG: hypothetical protein HFE84_08400 [Lachnospiraceae bacterium]|nr:hypothetical protein [Lachnospiraceae bacterium]